MGQKNKTVAWSFPLINLELVKAEVMVVVLKRNIILYLPAALKKQCIIIVGGRKIHLSPSLFYFSPFSLVLKSSGLIKSPTYFCSKDDISLTI